MIFRRYISFVLSGLLILIIIFNFYFIRIIIKSSRSQEESNLFVINKSLEKEKIRLISNDLNKNIPEVELIQEKVIKGIRMLPSRYFKPNINYIHVLEKIFLELKVRQNTSSSSIADIVENWPSARQLLPTVATELGTVIELLRNCKIVKVDNAKFGTQLKLMLTFENGLRAVFKPQWYTRTTKIKGLVYYGKDRHNAEVVAFYLASLLSLRRVPLALIRKWSFNNETEDFFVHIVDWHYMNILRPTSKSSVDPISNKVHCCI